MTTNTTTDHATCPDCRGRGRLFAGTAVGYIRCQRCRPIQTTPITPTNNTTRRNAP
jgi:hypothetical protein